MWLHVSQVCLNKSIRLLTTEASFHQTININIKGFSPIPRIYLRSVKSIRTDCKKGGSYSLQMHFCRVCHLNNFSYDLVPFQLDKLSVATVLAVPGLCLIFRNSPQNCCLISYCFSSLISSPIIYLH